MGEGDTVASYCLQWQPKESYLSKGLKEDDAAKDVAPPTIHHLLAEPSMRHPR